MTFAPSKRSRSIFNVIIHTARNISTIAFPIGVQLPRVDLFTFTIFSNYESFVVMFHSMFWSFLQLIFSVARVTLPIVITAVLFIISCSLFLVNNDFRHVVTGRLSIQSQLVDPLFSLIYNITSPLLGSKVLRDAK